MKHLQALKVLLLFMSHNNMLIYMKLVEAGLLIPWKIGYGIWWFEGPESDKPVSPTLWLAMQKTPSLLLLLLFFFFFFR